MITLVPCFNHKSAITTITLTATALIIKLHHFNFRTIEHLDLLLMPYLALFETPYNQHGNTIHSDSIARSIQSTPYDLL